MPKKAKGGPRDTITSMRLPAKLRYGLQLTSRLYRIPMADVIVRALNDALTSENGGLFVYLPGKELPVFLLPKVWDELESVRLVKLALVQPLLLSGPENDVWKRIRDDDRYWQATKKSAKSRTIEQLQVDALERDWNELTENGDLLR